jgi:cobalt-zinc-cadmium efflux system outer membrane protein
MLNQLIGEKPDHHTQVRVERLELAPPVSLEKLLGLARRFHFGLRARVAEVEQQGYEVELAYNERWPSITVSPYLQKQTASSRETMLGIGVSIPLPLWDRNKGNIQAAEARQAQLAKWPTDTLASFRESAAEADEHYRLGALSVNTYTELQKQYVESVNAVLDSQVGALRARMGLEQLTGKPLANDGAATTPLARE